jgi:hypothetical protein
MEMKISGKGPTGKPLTQWTGQVKRDIGRRGQFWEKAEEIQEWTDKRQMETPLQKLTHESGNDIRKKKKRK